MTAILKATAGVQSRWTECLQRYYPFNDPDLADHLLVVLSYVAAGAPQIWSETESKGTKGCKTSPIEEIHVVQKKFERHQGELAAVVCVFKAWEKVPKRERLRWCRRNHVNNGSMGNIQEVWIRFQSEVQKMGRRKSLRSAEGANEDGGDPGTVFGQLANLLVKAFADCCYMRWHTGQTFINLVSGAPKIIDFSDLGLFEAFSVTLPTYILYLPNVTSRGREDDFNPLTEVSISLVIPDNIAQNACKTIPLLMKSVAKVDPLAPVKVNLPVMGDAVVLRLAGNRTALDELETDIYKACGDIHRMLLDIKVHEPDGKDSGWKLEMFCQVLYQPQIEKLMVEKVRLTMDELESEVELQPFPNHDSALKLLVGAGAHVQEVQSNQHPVLIYFIRCTDKPRATHDELTEDLVTETLEKFGKIEEIQKSRDFPDETLWGSARFEFLSSALRAAKEANGTTLLNTFIMKVVHIESDCQVYKLNFHWRRCTLVRNRLHMYFLNEEDLTKFKKQKLHYEFKREYEDDELKAIISTENTYSNLPDHTSMMSQLDVYPKFTTYNHHVIYEASEADMPKVRDQLKERMKESFTDPDLIDITFETPKAGAPIMTGTFNSYSVQRLMRLEDYIGYYEGSTLLAGGEMATDRRVHMDFAIPTEALAKLEPELKNLNKKHRYSRSESRSEGDESGDDAQDFYRTDIKVVVDNNSNISVKPEGELISVRVFGDNYWSRIGQEMKLVPKLLRAHVLHVKGSLVSALLAINPDSKQPNVMQIMADTDTFIQVIKRNSLVHIYGPQKNVVEAMEHIKGFLSRPPPGDSTPLSKTPQRPSTSRAGRGRRRINPVPVATAPPVSILPSTSSSASVTTSCSSAECPVCLCPVSGEPVSLSLCGHAYCSECFRDLVTACKNDRRFPVRCVLDACNRCVLNVDIDAVCSAENGIPMTDLLTASMQAFQRKNITRVYPCITPDCEMVYRKCTSQQEGMVRAFMCPLCKVNLCTYCHCAYHTGLSCTVFEAMQDVDTRVKAWMDEDKDFRKLCPNCKTGIEKVDGCDHLHCTACKADICWVCLQFFMDARKMSYHRCSGEDADSDTESER